MAGLLIWVSFSQDFVDGIVNSLRFLERVHRFCSVVIGVCQFINEVSERAGEMAELVNYLVL